MLSREPYLLFFPLGALLAVCGVLPWLLFGVGAFAEYPSLFHSIVQVEGFLTAYALGFLFTFVPRRTRTAPPPLWQLFLAAGLVVALVALAWWKQWVASQAVWLFLLAFMVTVGALRFAKSEQQFPDGAFIWLPFAFAMGAGGSLLTALAPSLGMALPMAHPVGQALLTQGLFTGLILGVGRLVVPGMIHGKALQPGGRGSRFVHALLALGLVLSFVAELWVAGPITYMARALLVAGMAWFALELHRTPERTGAHRWLIWAAIWMLPLGYGAMAFVPAYRVALEHVVFIGGFGLIVLALSTHVVLSHGNHNATLEKWPWQMPAVAVLLLTALVCRIAANVDAARMRTWLALAAGAFLMALVAWAWLVVPRMRAAKEA